MVLEGRRFDGRLAPVGGEGTRRGESRTALPTKRYPKKESAAPER